MKTYSELKQFIESTGCTFECNPIEHTFEYYNLLSNKFEKSTIVTGYTFGINNPAQRSGKSEWQWVWFESFSDKLDESTKFFFSHRYSMNNGKTYKGWEERARINDRIEKAIA